MNNSDKIINLPKPISFSETKIKSKLCDYIKPELDRFRELCNFTDDELEYFNLRSKGVSNVAISLEMNICEAKVSLLARSVKDKIKRVGL
jgi:DNA-binding NarL/FixJ family response regulator